MMLDDLRYAWRLLLKAPGFAALTMLTLTAGIAFALYMASVVHSLGFTELPWPRFDRLVVVRPLFDGSDNGRQIPYRDFVEFEKAQTSLERLIPGSNDVVALSGKRFPENFAAFRLHPSAWSVHGISPIMGRILQPADSERGAQPVVVIGADLWKSYFGGDAAIVGSQVKIDGVITTIVGIMPSGFRFPTSEQIWLPFVAPISYEPGKGQHVTVMGYLKAGVTRSQASADFATIASRLAKSWPKTNVHSGAKVIPYVQIATSNANDMYLTVGCAATLLLLLVWINAGNLLLARATERQHESAIRAALGAPKHRLLRHMICEGLILALGAAVLGLFLAGWALEATNAILGTLSGAQEFVPFWFKFSLAPRDGVAAVILAILSTLLIGAIPASRSIALDLCGALRDGTRHGQGRAAGRFTGLLVIIQIGVSSMLLVAACVLPYGVYRMLHADYGCRNAGIATAKIDLSRPVLPYQTSESRLKFWQGLEAQAQSLPGHPLFAMINALPGDGTTLGSDVVPEGMSIVKDKYPTAGMYAINPDFFKTLDIPILSGRPFNNQDRSDTLKVAVVDANLAVRFWPHQSVLGKRIMLDVKDKTAAWFTIVGVSQPVVHGTPDGDRGNEPGNIYVPYTQHIPGSLRIALAGESDMNASLTRLRDLVQRTDPNLAPEELESFAALQAMPISGLEILSDWCIALGIISLLLAISGIYGITARTVGLRTHEIGVRRAVGASDSAVLRMLMRRSLIQLAIGLPVGLVLGWGVTILMSVFLYQIGLAVPLAMGFIAVLISAIIIAATLIPARRAISFIPGAALRYE